MIIKFYDNENYEYPLISILEEDFDKFRELTETYQTEEDYNWEGFLNLLEKNEIPYKEISPDREMFF